MSTLQCRIQFLDDTNPFNTTSFPEPSKPPTYTFLTNIPLLNQVSGVKKLLKAPHKVLIKFSYFTISLSNDNRLRILNYLKIKFLENLKTSVYQLFVCYILKSDRRLCLTIVPL